MKVCTKCKIGKPLFEFYKRADGVQGVRAHCKSCWCSSTSAWQKANKERALAYAAKWRKANPGRHRAAVDAWQKALTDKERARHRERAKAYSAEWRKTNPDKERAAQAARYAANGEKIRAYTAAWRKLNKPVCAEYNAAREARQILATPSWANRDTIRQIYASAAAKTAATGQPHHVDHIVPLRSKFVSGLHVEYNLRVITAKENSSKGNRSWPDSYERHHQIQQ